MQFIKKLMTRKWLLIGIGAVLVVGGVYLSQSGENGATPIAIVRGTVIAEVVAAGKTKPADDVELAFETTGRVERVFVKIGDRVKPGDALIQLDQSELAAQLLEASAALSAEQAELDELKRGSRPEELAIQEAKVANAKSTLAASEQALIDALRDAYTKADDAVRNKADQFISNARSQNPQLSFTVADQALELKIESERANLEALLNVWKQETDAIGPTSNLPIVTELVSARLNRVRTFLDQVALALNQLSASSSLSQTTIDGYRTDVATARTNVNTAATNASTNDKSWRSAASDLNIEERQLTLDLAGASSEDLAAQEAAVRQAEAKRAVTIAQLSKRTIRAPIEGIVTKQETSAGEIVGANAVVAAIISDRNYEIEANIAEVGIGKIALANPVRLEFDAFPGETFAGRVVAIDPAETIVDGVANFKVTVVFEKEDPRLKSGLSADVSIETDRRENVLIVPQYALIVKSDGTYAAKREGETTREVKIEIGVRGIDGNAEVLSGLAEGDMIVPASTTN